MVDDSEMDVEKPSPMPEAEKEDTVVVQADDGAVASVEVEKDDSMPIVEVTNTDGDDKDTSFSVAGELLISVVFCARPLIPSPSQWFELFCLLPTSVPAALKDICVDIASVRTSRNAVLEAFAFQ